MRSDLLYAKESVDWAEANFPPLQRALNIWLQNNVNVEFKDVNPDGPDCLIVAVEKEPFPLKFSVEFGVYLNAIWSSLDILATSLAQRHGVPRPDSASFPIAKSEAVFLAGKDFKGAELIKGLPASERALIEGLKPYKGGNDLLWSLHNLDIVRKHRRLLTIEVTPSQFRLLANLV